jgi:hypothetical protein
MRCVATTPQGTLLVEGKSTNVLELPDGRQVKGRMTMEEIIFSLKHYWCFVDSDAREYKHFHMG